MAGSEEMSSIRQTRVLSLYEKTPEPVPIVSESWTVMGSHRATKDFLRAFPEQ